MSAFFKLETMKKILLLFAASLVLSASSFSQPKVNFTQRMAAPTYLFPEFAGWHGGLQANLQYRNQWSGIPSNIVFYNAAVDGYSDKLHSGFSLNMSHERYGTGIINNNYVELNWSPKLTLVNGLTIMPAVSGKFIQTSFDWSQWHGGGPYQYGQVYDQSLQPTSSSLNRGSVGAGVAVIYYETFLVAHVHDINQPDLSYFANSESRLPRTYSLLAGRVFSSNNFKFTPSISYHRQGEFNMVTLACNAQYKWIYVGGKYDIYGLAGVALGAELKGRIRLSYSYDVTTSRLQTQALGSHEIALRLWFYKDRAKKQFLSNMPLM